MSDTDPFWETKELSEMTKDEWESLCDGCGKCCVLKLEDYDTAEIYYTDVSCKLLCPTSAQCTDYPNRKRHVPDCVILTPGNLDEISWMPQSCSYRRLHEGKSLPDWHPLITGSQDALKSSPHSVASKVIPEGLVKEKDMPDHLYDWDFPL